MRTILRDSEVLILELSAYECHMVSSAVIRAALAPRGAADDGFRLHFGWPGKGEPPTRLELRVIHDRLPVWNDDDTLYSQGFTHREMEIVVRCLSELANGLQILDWEFQTLTGAYRSDFRELLHAVHRVLVGPKE